MKSRHLALRIFIGVLVALCLIAGLGATPSAHALPTPPQTPKLKGTLTAKSSKAGDQFGYAIATDGVTTVIGAPNALRDATHPQGKGAAYVFIKKGNGWKYLKTLTAPDGAFQDAFGHAVAVSGSTIIVGAPRTFEAHRHGTAYIYTQVAKNKWSVPQEIVPTGSDEGDQFGSAIAVSGQHALISAESANNSQGAVYAFDQSGNLWAQSKRLVSGYGNMVSDFGADISLEGQTAVVGVTGGGHSAAFVLTRDDTQNWNITTELPAPGQVVPSDDYGARVALHGDSVAVSAVGMDGGKGEVFLFTRDTQGNWGTPISLTASDGASNDIFGDSLAFGDNTLLVGADFATFNKQPFAGAVYRFTATNGVWTQTGNKFGEKKPVANDVFGFYSIGLVKNTAFIGAMGARKQRGAVYIFSI